jgi:DivIVA domain-containing protein
MAISFSRPDPSSPAAVSAAVFTVARRGYDQTEVRDFLRMVSAELARLQERERFLESELKAMQTRGMSSPGMLDEEVVTALLGEEAARVLSAAREASAQIRQRAEESATRLVKEAASDAARLREEAELEAVRRREDAAADAEAEIELAKQQGRDMVNEARDYREKVLSELARRRELARAQIEQLVANRDRLLNAFERARLATDDVMTGLVSVDDDLPSEYVNLAPTTGPVKPIVLENPFVTEAVVESAAPSSVVQMFDREKHDSEVDVADDAVELVAHEEVVADEVVAEVVVEEVVVALTVVDEPVDAVEEVVLDEGDDVETVVETVEKVEASVVDDVIDEVVDEVVVDEAPAAPAEAPSNVVSLFGKDRQRTEPVTVNPDHPSVEKPVSVIEAPTPPRDAVDDIFARLRASSMSKPTEGTVVVARADKSESTEKTQQPKKAAPKPVVAAVRDEAAFAHRDEVLAPLVTAMARKLKRVLADEENEALEYLRGKKPVITLEKMYGDSAVHVAKYMDAIFTDVLSAAQSGAAVVTDAKRKITKNDIREVMTESVERLLVGPLREKLSTVLALHASDKDEVAKAVRGVYRQWKSTNIDEHIDDVACLAYSRGMYVTFAPGTQLCWMVDPNGPACADAEDNSLAGCVVLGDEFPTGHTQPLAHAGCRCLLAPMQH